MFSLASLLFSFIFTVTAVAQTMTNEDYRIQMGNLNSIAGTSENENYKINITSGESVPGLFEGKNFKVKSGFQYVPRSSPFSFAISNTKIDFGLLAPTNPVTRTTILSVTNTDTAGYNVSVAENHELTAPTTGARINDTTCDNGQCTENSSAEWSNTLTYGLGYRCDREINTCVEGDISFINKDYFKQFPDSSKDESATTIMSGGTGSNIEATIMYKLNISSSQPAGTYSNVITYIATPNY